MTNPFYYGNSVPTDLFIDRGRELKRIASRIANRGQSTAIIGEPRTGKTSLLEYLAAPETRQQLFGPTSHRLLFSYLDAQAFVGEFTQAQFWSHVLQPVYERAVLRSPDSALALAHQVCVENDFRTFVLERLLAQMRQDKWSLVLLLDEFDLLLHHPVLNSAEFFGGLRSLASRAKGALALVIACRRPLARLNEDTQEFNRTGSSYFNFFDEITLGPLTAKAVNALLDRAGDRFIARDRRFITRVAGGHPYLLQVTASALWEAYEDGDLTAASRFKAAGQAAHDQVAGILSDIWRLWPPETRRLFSVIALSQLSTLPDERQEALKGRAFDVEKLLETLRDLGPELRSLKKQGFVAEDKAIPGGWRVRPAAFLWWMADEVTRAVRNETELGKWIQAGAMRCVGDMLKTGAPKLIEGMAKNAGGSP